MLHISKQSEELYSPVFRAIEELAKNKDHFIVAIDGRCGSGKSILAHLIAEKFDCNIFHMDDFFLPLEMKTPERLAEPGGNVHSERFLEEVLKPLKEENSIQYQPYDCQIWDFTKAYEIERKQINIVEGSYSLHPTLEEFYDLKVFLTVDPEVQKERILKRNGEEKLQMFINRWIPMEEHYFSELKVEEQCDIVIDTTNL